MLMFLLKRQDNKYSHTDKYITILDIFFKYGQFAKKIKNIDKIAALDFVTKDLNGKVTGHSHETITRLKNNIMASLKP